MARNPLLFLLPCAAVLILGAAYHGDDLPKGPFCGKTGECCLARDDSCAHEILGTLCYCDDHCNRTHDDCCPDYEEVCLGIMPVTPRPTPPPQPQIRHVCMPGDRKTKDCNQCKCEVTNQGVHYWDCEREDCIISEEVIDNVNQGGTWRATNYSDFAARTLKDGLVYKLGTFPFRPTTKRMNPIRYDKDIQYPREFDARSQWPRYITDVIDQGWCGSDWAVVVAGVTSDRLAILSNGIERVTLSPQTLLSCNLGEQHGCKGGNIDDAWNFVGHHGLVEESCFRYEATQVPCPYKRRGNLISDGCRPLLSKRTSRYTVGPPAKLNVEKDIMFDIMESGPVHATMNVYQDFFHYRSGVYHHTPYGNRMLHGLHSVRIVGWGEEQGERYWTVANSWGKQWGENGYFRIRRGVNEAEIETFVVTVIPEVTRA